MFLFELPHYLCFAVVGLFFSLFWCRCGHGSCIVVVLSDVLASFCKMVAFIFSDVTMIIVIFIIVLAGSSDDDFVLPEAFFQLFSPCCLNCVGLWGRFFFPGGICALSNYLLTQLSCLLFPVLVVSANINDRLCY